KHSTLLAGSPSLEETRFFMINPTLHALGYTHSVYEPVPTQSGSVARVDYTLFPNAESFLEARDMRGSLSFFRASVGLSIAVAWTGGLDEVPAAPVHEENDADEADVDDQEVEETAEAPEAQEEAQGILPAAELDA